MRMFTKKRDIVRTGAMRFATAFLKTKLDGQKKELRSIISSVEWSKSKHGKSVKGNAAAAITLSPSFGMESIIA
ncbi:unnamed protein product [Rhodiola kirilowii]